MVSIMLLATIHIMWNILTRTDGTFIYGLDDPYIHLSIAKTIIDHGMYGVTGDSVSFANSSVIWPLLIAVGGAIIGQWELLPLILNIFSGVGCFWMIKRLCERNGIHPLGMLLISILMFVLTPFMPLVFNGMEHVLHILAMLMVFYYYLDLPYSEHESIKRSMKLYASIAFAILVRPEVVILAFSLIVVLMLRNQKREAFGVLVAVGAPIVISGTAMILAGGEFISYSLMVKGKVLEWEMFTSFPDVFYYDLLIPLFEWGQWQLYIILILVVGTAVHSSLVFPRRRISEFLSAIALMLPIQIFMVGHGPLHRYSGYMVAISSVAVSLYWMWYIKEHLYLKRSIDLRLASLPVFLIYLFTLFPLVRDGLYLYRQSTTASVNIFEQQYQMALFLKKYYHRQHVALNDIGLTVFVGNVIPIDLVGLSERRVARARRSKAFTTDSIRAVVEGYNPRIAVLYESWFTDEMVLPSEWVQVRSWRIANNIVCGDDVVSFYAIDTSAVDLLKLQLKEFEQGLPATVAVVEHKN